ncbi:MAG: hypothetical protein KBD06_00950 [Candidatus Pacebacteria bacterium]|nr:hypothetical protein [Candidatus Paceibacterota bacterium]
MDTKSLVTGVIIGAVVFGAAGYFFATKRVASGGARQFTTTQGPGGQFRGQAARAGGALIGGEVIARDERSITIKDQSGSTKIILLAESSQITKSAAGAPGDVTVGTNVMVTGEANADGSMTAQIVQIRPAGLPPQTGGPTPGPRSAQ